MKYIQNLFLIIISCSILISCSNSKLYIVKKGDTAYKIAKKHNIKLNILKKNNLLISNSITKGNILYIGKKYKYYNVNKIYINGSSSRTLKTFITPLKQIYINSSFRYRVHPVLGRKILHTGVDLRASMNTSVYSVGKGVVTYAGRMSGYGKIIIINNGHGYETRFAHLNKLLVKKNQKVYRGKLIAKSGRTGRVTGAHLHYEIRYKKKPIDPIKLYY